MAKKTTTSTTNGAPKARKPRTAIEKVFVVASDPPRLVAGYSKRKVEAAVWQRPEVRIATAADLRTMRGVQIETIEAPAVPGAETAGQAGAAAGDGGSANADASVA